MIVASSIREFRLIFVIHARHCSHATLTPQEQTRHDISNMCHIGQIQDSSNYMTFKLAFSTSSYRWQRGPSFFPEVESVHSGVDWKSHSGHILGNLNQHVDTQKLSKAPPPRPL